MIEKRMYIQRIALLNLLLFIYFGIFAQDKKIDRTSILTPRAHNPVFVEPGKTFVVELRSSHTALDSTWKAILKNDLNEWNVVIKSFTPTKIHHGTENGSTLEIAVPANTPPELMELIIHDASGIEYCSARSVNIVPNFEEDFYIFHQSDEHLTIDKAVEPGGKSSKKWGNGSKEALQWLAPILNIINPRFVLHTGDNTQIYHEPNSWGGIKDAEERMERFIDGLSGYHVPTVCIPGNHDIGFPDYVENQAWRKVYHQTVGKSAFSFTMGSFYFLGSEWTNPEFSKWAKEDYLSHYANPNIKYRLLASHYYDGLETSTTIASAEKPADLLLIGHNHRTLVLQEEPYRVLSVGTAQDYQRAAFFNFERTPEGWHTKQPLSHANDINVHRLVGDYGLPTVTAEFSVDNSGTAESNRVTITNKLPLHFYNGRIRFLMKKGNYSVDGGDILSTYDYNEGNKTAVIVKVNIKESSVTNLSIEKVP